MSESISALKAQVILICRYALVIPVACAMLILGSFLAYFISLVIFYDGPKFGIFGIYITLKDITTRDHIELLIDAALNPYLFIRGGLSVAPGSKKAIFYILLFLLLALVTYAIVFVIGQMASGYYNLHRNIYFIFTLVTWSISLFTAWLYAKNKFGNKQNSST